MFRGPNRDQGSGGGAIFSQFEFGTLLQGGGAVWNLGNYQAVSANVGTGNTVVLYPYLNLLAPSAATDIKWIDVAFGYAENLNLARFQGGSADTTIAARFSRGQYYPTDAVSRRDGELPGTSILERRWQIHRLPNPTDPENAHRLAPGGVENEYPCVSDVALGDVCEVRIRPVAVDPDQGDPVFRATEEMQFAIMWGTRARD